MDCERFDKTTMELLYGELDELSEAAALRHLHHCTRCRDIWGHLRTTRELAEIPLEEPPAGLFESIIDAEARAHRSLPARERFSRAISVMAGYAMRPQLAMAALLLLMIGSSLVFVRSGPLGHGEVSVTEVGKPYSEPVAERSQLDEALVFDGVDEPERGAEHRRLNEQAAESGAEPESISSEKSGSSRELYAAALSAYQEGRYAEAERLFSEVASTGGEQAASAALHEGHAARNGSGCQRAASLYDAVAEQYTGSTVADEASWLAASCYRAMGQLRRAASHYESLEKRPAFAARASKALEEINSQLLATAAKSNSDSKAAAPTSAAASKPAAKPNAAEAKPAIPEPDPPTGKAAAPAAPSPKTTEPADPDSPPTQDDSAPKP